MNSLLNKHAKPCNYNQIQLQVGPPNTDQEFSLSFHNLYEIFKFLCCIECETIDLQIQYFQRCLGLLVIKMIINTAAGVRQ